MKGNGVEGKITMWNGEGTKMDKWVEYIRGGNQKEGEMEGSYKRGKIE